MRYTQMTHMLSIFWTNIHHSYSLENLYAPPLILGQHLIQNREMLENLKKLSLIFLCEMNVIKDRSISCTKLRDVCVVWTYLRRIGEWNLLVYNHQFVATNQKLAIIWYEYFVLIQNEERKKMSMQAPTVDHWSTCKCIC